MPGRVMQLVERGGDIVRVDAELGAGDHGHEHVVQGLGLQSNVQLVDPEPGAGRYPVHVRDFEVESRVGDARIPAEPFDHVGGLLGHDVRAFHDRDGEQDEKNDDECHDKSFPYAVYA